MTAGIEQRDINFNKVITDLMMCNRLSQERSSAIHSPALLQQMIRAPATDDPHPQRNFCELSRVLSRS
jgi:hypothetical protein